MTGELKLTKKKLILSEDVEDIIRRRAVPIGNGAHVTCPKEHVGKTVYLVVVKENRKDDTKDDTKDDGDA